MADDAFESDWPDSVWALPDPDPQPIPQGWFVTNEELGRLRVAAGILKKIAAQFEIIPDAASTVFIGHDGCGIFVRLDAADVAYLAVVAEGTETPDAH